MTALANPAVAFDGPVQHAHSFADQTVFFTDPAGNHYAVYTPKNSGRCRNTAKGRMTGVGYIELEAPDVNASIDFYAKVLGFELQGRSENARRQRSRWQAARR